MAPTGSINTSTPTYRWNGVAGAKSYRLIVWDANNNVLTGRIWTAKKNCRSGSCTVNSRRLPNLRNGTAATADAERGALAHGTHATWTQDTVVALLIPIPILIPSRS